MNAFNNFKIGVKLLGSFLVVALVIVVVAVVGYINMKSIADRMRLMYNDHLLPVRQLGAVSAAMEALQGDAYLYVLLPDQRADTKQDIEANEKTVVDGMTEYRATDLAAEEQAGLAAFDKAWPAYQQTVAQVMTDTDAGNPAQALNSLANGGDMTNRSEMALTLMDQLIAFKVRAADEAHQQGDVTFAVSTRILVIATLIGLVQAVGLGLALSRSLANAAQMLVKTAGQIAQVDLPAFEVAIAAIAAGDLTQSVHVQTQPVDYAGKDEMGDLARNFNGMITGLQGIGVSFEQMTANLSQLVGQVTENATSVSAAAGQLNTAAAQASEATSQISLTIQQVAQGTSQQSDSVTQTVYSVEELKRAIEAVAQGAGEQAQGVAQANTVMSQLSTAVEGIRQGATAQAQEIGRAHV
jgi:methyl-accepting chemotaxis protein